MECRLMVSDRNYTSWYYVDPEKYTRISAPELETVSPIERKWFTRDTVRVIDGELTVVHSTVRTQKIIAGVLVLEQNRTFGRTENKKRLLYKCIPDDKHLPAFLIPYEIQLRFSKSIRNKYVLFSFDQWTDARPRGLLVETLGDVDRIDVFYEYQLYCRSLHVPLAEMTDKTRAVLREHTKDEYIHQIAANPAFRIATVSADSRVFSIDPAGSVDFDDAFSISRHATNGNMVVSVYIANVYVWLETMGLWKSFSRRVSTIYLPDRKRPMLPTVLSDSLCSLEAGQTRFAFCMSVEITPEGTVLADTAEFRNVAVSVAHNYVYETPEMAADADYLALLVATQRADKSVVDSHDVVAFWMIQTNVLCGAYLAKRETGIFRSAALTNPEPDAISAAIPETLDTETRRFIHNWRNTTCQYTMYRPDADLGHAVMAKKTYVHITSPIRRLVDLLNQMLFMEVAGMVSAIGPDAREFRNQWMTHSQMEYINTTMRSIRKVQTDCEVLRAVVSRPDWLSKPHLGIVFDKMVRADATYTYIVYLSGIRLVSRVNSLVELENYHTYEFKMFMFEDEEHIRNKIRLQLCAL